MHVGWRDEEYLRVDCSVRICRLRLGDGGDGGCGLVGNFGSGNGRHDWVVICADLVFVGSLWCWWRLGEATSFKVSRRASWNWPIWSSSIKQMEIWLKSQRSPAKNTLPLSHWSVPATPVLIELPRYLQMVTVGLFTCRFSVDFLRNYFPPPSSLIFDRLKVVKVSSVGGNKTGDMDECWKLMSHYRHIMRVHSTSHPSTRCIQISHLGV